MKLNTPPTQRPRFAGMIARLPGPDRKRTPTEYHYVLTYRDPTAEATGSVMVWEVRGGRMPYQVALERIDRDQLRWHCSCADAIYRGEDVRHSCKHVRGLIESLEAVALPAAGSFRKAG